MKTISLAVVALISTQAHAGLFDHAAPGISVDGVAEVTAGKAQVWVKMPVGYSPERGSYDSDGEVGVLVFEAHPGHPKYKSRWFPINFMPHPSVKRVYVFERSGRTMLYAGCAVIRRSGCPCDKCGCKPCGCVSIRPPVYEPRPRWGYQLRYGYDAFGRLYAWFELVRLE